LDSTGYLELESLLILLEVPPEMGLELDPPPDSDYSPEEAAPYTVD
jgi:hypothetical protein